MLTWMKPEEVAAARNEMRHDPERQAMHAQLLRETPDFVVYANGLLKQADEQEAAGRHAAAIRIRDIALTILDPGYCPCTCGRALHE